MSLHIKSYPDLKVVIMKIFTIALICTFGHLSLISQSILGESTDGVGVQGNSSSFVGVYGGSSNIGVYGFSGSSKGVVGYGFIYDFNAEGPGINYGTTSSIRWKRNIINIPSPLEKLSRLRGVYFDWDEAHGGKHDIGFIAEEVGKVIPEIVGYEENGVDASGMDYSKMTPLLVEAANAMRNEYLEEIAAIKKVNQELRKENRELKTRLDKIERMLASQDILQSQ